MMDGGGKSDEAIVAGKPMNKAERSAAESVERRAEAEGNASQFSTDRIQSREDVSQGLERIRQAALPSTTRGGSRMRESRTYGSVRGALSNERPYRDRTCAVPTIFNRITVLNGGHGASAPLPSAPRRRVLPVEEDSTSIVDGLIE